VKVAVVGAGSTYTPELVSGLARERDRLGLRELVLHDIVTDRLEIVGGLARRMLDAQGYRGAVATTTNLDRAIEGADFVLFQLRVGGQQTRLLDETLPLPCGCVGQETTGMGGFALALRTIPVVLDIAARVREIAAPDAWIVDFTNPVGIVTRALLDAGHRAIGLCNVAIGFQRRFAAQYGVPPERVLIDQVGLNHLTWIRAVLVDGVDVLDELLAERLEEIADEVELPARLLRELGAIPSYYLRYFYAHDQIVAEQRTGVPRAATVDAIERQLLDLYQDPTLTEKPTLLEQRGGAYYSEAAVGLVTSLASDGGEVHVVDVRNNGTVAGLADDDVVELPARVDAKGAAPLPQRPLAPDMLGLVQHAAAYERLAVRAALTGDPVVAHRALLAHPLIGQDSTARALLDTFLEAEGDFLPQFAVPAARP